MVGIFRSHRPSSGLLVSAVQPELLRYSLSYRDIEELMKERGVELDHATVQR